MSYHYRDHRHKLFTEEGQVQFLRIRDKAFQLTEQAGAVCSSKLFLADDAWTALACMDRLVELGDLREVTSADVAGQERVFVRRERR